MKRLNKPVVIGITLGIVLVILQNTFDVDQAVFRTYYFTGAVILLLCVILVYMFYIMSYNKKMQEAMVLLHERKTEDYVKEVSRLEQKAMGQNLKNVLRLNLSAGYCDLKEYEKAIELLEGIDGKKLKGEVELVRRLNLCVSYFYSGQMEKGLQLYDESRVLFVTSQKKGLHCGNIAVLDMLAMIERGQYEQAEKLLEVARTHWSQPRLEEDFQYVEEKLHQR